MDKEILLDLRGENNEAYGKLYRQYFGLVNSFITRNSGTTADAEDVFQDTLVVLFDKLKGDNFELTASLKTYVFAIAKILGLKRLRTASREIELTDLHSEKLVQDVNSAIDREQNLTEKLRFYLLKITKHCGRLIRAIYYEEKTLDDIQTEYGYSTKHNAINQKHKCINQIKKVKELERLK